MSFLLKHIREDGGDKEGVYFNIGYGGVWQFLGGSSGREMSEKDKIDGVKGFF